MSEGRRQRIQLVKRRDFVVYTCSVAALAGFSALASSAARMPDIHAVRLQDTGLTSAHWQTIARVQQHLLPSEPAAPGAADIGSMAYLQWVLADPELADERRRFFAGGAERVEEISLAAHGMGFGALDEDQRENVLRQMEQQQAHWLTELLHYIFESLLTDPVYGGNPGAIGWKWLGHNPGHKRPPADKRYFLL